MKISELRAKYLDFFERRHHKVFPSDTLVPDDESVLFTSAGMNQFKPYFLGKKKGVKRAASCQKCLRTGDLYKVGTTAYHHTFFEMLGNFSFGDYFKKEAIRFAWDFLINELNLGEESLWVSVYQEDEEAYRIWEKVIQMPPNRIVKLGQDSNFWPANAPKEGPDGPCGPCSEIFFDKGKDKGCGRADCGPDCDCQRFVEIWNLVFTQFDRKGISCLDPLPQKNIDTGMGLERMASVLQGKDTNFDIDIFVPAVNLARDILKVETAKQDTRSSINAIVDHARAVIFAIADGVYPSNEERGYVIRKILRRASVKAGLLGYHEPFIYRFTEIFAGSMGDFYNEIREKKDIISKVIKAEEEKYLSIKKQGVANLQSRLDSLKSGEIEKAELLFEFYDTHGLSLEETGNILQGLGIDISPEDEKRFKVLLSKQQERSRKKSMFDENIFSSGNISFSEKTEFSGYRNLREDSKVVKILSVQGKEKKVLKAPEEGIIILDKSPFYAESGGQLADRGIIKNADIVFEVEKALKAGEAIMHQGKVIKGVFSEGDKVCAEIDTGRRKALARAHTATHLLQTALRRVLGEHVTQQGSMVDEDRLRFDFTHFEKLSPAEIEEVESIVNDFILRSDKVEKKLLDLETARKEGALAFFKDKYGQKVRVVSIGGYSKELCGGTHLDFTSQVGLFSIVSESSVSSGIRRIEAVVGRSAYTDYKKSKDVIFSLRRLLKARRGELEESVKGLLEEIKEKSLAADRLKQDKFSLAVKEWLGKADLEKVASLELLLCDERMLKDILKEKRLDAQKVLDFIDIVKKQKGSLFVFCIFSDKGTKKFICSSNTSLSAKEFVCHYQDKLALKGGGRANLVQGLIHGCYTDDYLVKLKEYCAEFIRKGT